MQDNITVNISSEIDDIIAQAMSEYQQARGTEVFENNSNNASDIIAAANVDAPAYEDDTSTTAVTADSYPLTPEESVEHTIPNPIPNNSPSILVDENTSRFSSAIWFENIQNKVITVAGLGGIGSYVTFLLSRLHPSCLYLYDDDIVDSTNMSGQLYSVQDCGKAKVYSISDMIRSYSSYYNIIAFKDRFTSESCATDIMICGFDNMTARNVFFTNWLEHVNSLPAEDRSRCLFIDGRLAAESLQVLCITGDDTYNIERYENGYLFSDDEADETICSYKQTSFMAAMIGSIMVNLFVNFCANQCNPLIPRDLPFFTEYSAETMYFKITQ